MIGLSITDVATILRNLSWSSLPAHPTLQLVGGDGFIQIEHIANAPAGVWDITAEDGFITINDYPGRTIMPDAVFVIAHAADFLNDELMHTDNATLARGSVGLTIPATNGVDYRVCLLSATSHVVTPEEQVTAVAPTLITLSNSIIAPDAVAGTVIGQLTSNGDPHAHFALSGVDSSWFEIDPTDQLILITAQNAEAPASYDVMVTADNEAGRTTQLFTLHVPDDPIENLDVALHAIGPQSGQDVVIHYTVNQDVTCDVILCLASETPPIVSDFARYDLPAYINIGQVTLTSTQDDIILELPDNLDDTYRVALLPADGMDEDIILSSDVVLNTVVTPSIAVVGATSVITETRDFVSNTMSSLPFTAAAGTDRLLVAMVSYLQPNPTASSIDLTLGSTPFELVDDYGSTTGGLPRVQVFYLRDANIPNTSEFVTLTPNSPINQPIVTLVEVENVRQFAPIGTNGIGATLSEVQSGSASIQTFAANALAISCISTSTTAALPFVVESNSGAALTQIEEHAAAPDARKAAAAYELLTHADNITHTWDWATAGRYYQRIVEIQGAI